MSAAQNESRKRGKKRYAGGHHGKRWKGSRELEVGMEGILITCNMNERKCTAEAFNLLNEYADNLYGAEKLQDNTGSSSDEDAEEEDVDVALKKEVAQLQASGKKQERRFQALDSGANNVIFIKTQNLESDKLVHHILSDLHTTKKKKSRVILRMLPVTGTCKAFQDDMVKYLTTYLEPWFKTPNCATYQIAFKARNSSHNKRDEIIKSIAGLVGKLNPKNKVDLTNPELTVIVEVIKAVCCISVVKDYTLYRKYNVQEVVKEDAPKPDVTTDKTDADKPEQTETETEKQKPKGEAGETNQEGKKGAEENDENVSQDNEETVKGQGDGD
ncbi:putative THUMP domain-containing protein 1 [Scophthalmus maximus]|uniref:THUMP domain-containing protein 1 n=1 Tax=Scophthalmus maximus TaxID=52904 RepID=A0A2U9BNS5_SCOMX|nr:THUMP domain-containing protein 1 [Scophthalmus maximus]AWP05329.1 putative THUMP domain-containing protein 1 [Scophthalmus maximus]